MRVFGTVGCVLVVLVALSRADDVPKSAKDSSPDKTELTNSASKTSKTVENLQSKAEDKESSKNEKGDTGRVAEVKLKKDEKVDEKNVDDDLQYLSAADHNHGGSEESAKETTQSDEGRQGVKERVKEGVKKGVQEGVKEDVKEDVKEAPEQEYRKATDEDGAGEEEEAEEDEEEEEEAAAPFDESHDTERVLARGSGSLGDMMFQYATVSSIARSSKRRALFSSDFMPLLTLFPNAPIVIIEDDEIMDLQPLTNITLSETRIEFDSVMEDIPSKGSVEVVGETRSFKYFHVIMNSLNNEFTPSSYYISAADDYLEEVMRRALKNELKEYVEEEKKEEETNGVKSKDEEKKDIGFLNYSGKKDSNAEKVKDTDAEKQKIILDNEKTESDQTEKKTTGTAEQTQTKKESSIIDQLKNPYEKITLVGIHVPALFKSGTNDTDDEDEESAANEKKREEVRKEKEESVLSYFRAAMEYYRDEHSINGDFVQFVVVCEDLRWCIDHLNGRGVHFAIGGSEELDLNILAQCDHAVLTSSSVSWWSAWMTRGQVVYPASLSQINGVPLDDYVLPDWSEI